MQFALVSVMVCGGRQTRAAGLSYVRTPAAPRPHHKAPRSLHAKDMRSEGGKKGNTQAFINRGGAGRRQWLAAAAAAVGPYY